MKVHKSDDIRNIAVASHQGTGKTSMVEAILFEAGIINRMGKISDGNTVSDYRPEEIKKKISVSTSLISMEWKDKKVNFLDVPGFSDFQGELESALAAAENVMMLVDATAGIGVNTELISEQAKKLNKAQIFVINKLDRENGRFFKSIDSINDAVEANAVPVQMPIGVESEYHGVIDLIEGKAYVFDANGKTTETEIPADYIEYYDKYHQILMDAAAEGDDELLMKYLDGEALTDDEIRIGMKGAIAKGVMAPVLCGVAAKGWGAGLIMDFVNKYLPSPAEMMDMGKANDKFAGLVFKTVTDAFLGKLSYVKVMQGTLKADTPLVNVTKEKEEKIGSLGTFQGKTQLPVNEFAMGDIAVISKLAVTSTNTVLAAKGTEPEIDLITFSEPVFTVAIAPKSKNDEDKLGSALQKILEEDPTMTCVKDAETKQTLLTGMGDTHIEIALDRLQRQFGVAVETLERRLPYRETIRGKADRVEGKHKKQSGGHGQFGHVIIALEPCYDADFVFEEKVFGGSVPKQYFPAVEKGVRESLDEGVLAGYPVSNIKVTLLDGSYHPVDSSEMAFKIATNMAFRKACEQAKPVLMEPIVSVEIRVPDQYTGDIMSDMNTRRGRIMGMNGEGKLQVINAEAPLAEMSRYAIDLKSITQGRGKFTMKFARYEEAPQMVADKVIAAAKAEKE